MQNARRAALRQCKVQDFTDGSLPPKLINSRWARHTHHTCLSLQPLASSVGFGTTARVAPGNDLPDSGVTSESVGCYATPAQLGGSSRICPPTRPVSCYEEAHSPCEGSLLTLISRRPPRLMRGTHPHFRVRPRHRRRNVETGALAKCGLRNAECRMQSATTASPWRRLRSCGKPPRPA